MKSIRTTFALSVAALVAMFLVIGCGSEDRPIETSVINEITDTIVSNVGRTLKDARLAGPTPMEKPGDPNEVKLIRDITDFVIAGDNLYAVFEKGALVYNFADKTQRVVPTDSRLNAITFHDGNVFVGGDKLYTLEGSSLVPVSESYEGVITSLYSYDVRLMIGTEFGLYSKSIFGHEQLAEDISVSAMAADESGLWVGTRGNGLYRWDGESLRKRWLERDAALFDTVNTLAFNHDHLYVGTVHGFHIFDGGRWESLSEEEGLPSNEVVSIDASGWVVYIATHEGVISYWDGDFIPVKKLEDRQVNKLASVDGTLIATTDYDGIIRLKNGFLSTIVEPTIDMDFNILSLVP